VTVALSLCTKFARAPLNPCAVTMHAGTNLDLVVNHVVIRMAGLGSQAHALVKGKHNKRTTAFVKATMAACYVTIPTSDDIIIRLRLFLLCGQVSLLNALITQAESFMKQCIQTIKELPMILDTPEVAETVEVQVADFLAELMDALVCMPGHPENGPHYLTTALCSVIVRRAHSHSLPSCHRMRHVRASWSAGWLAPGTHIFTWRLSCLSLSLCVCVCAFGSGEVSLEQVDYGLQSADADEGDVAALHLLARKASVPPGWRGQQRRALPYTCREE
jgi:hypothetical protein